ncbi:MAG: hypothetical protein [Bacteriophage sp.]|nr:MAG: hypothetical protein [Bacteriophage sp.]
MVNKKTIPLKKNQPESSTKLDVAKRLMRYDRMSFNFSFLTNDRQFNLDTLQPVNHKKLLNKLKLLSAHNVTKVKLLPKEQGIEFIESLKKSITITEFKSSGRFDECDNNYCVFRISNVGRVIGKINNNLFYVLAIDTKFSLYDH